MLTLASVQVGTWVRVGCVYWCIGSAERCHAYKAVVITKSPTVVYIQRRNP